MSKIELLLVLLIVISLIVTIGLVLINGKLLQAIATGVIIVACSLLLAMLLYGWINDCKGTADVFINCSYIEDY